VIRARGQVLDEMIERNRAVAGASDPEAIRAQERYRRAGERLARLRLAQSEGAAPPEETDAARAELDAAERDLAQASASFRDSRARAGAGLAEAAAGRPAGSAVVGYVKFHAAASGATAGPDDSPARYLAFVLPAGRDDPVAVPLGPADRVDERVRAWRASLAADEDACRAAGAQLREALWDPVEPWIGDAALVLVVPDGAVHGVTLAALPDRDSGYLVESGPAFHYLSSERDAAGRASAGSGSGLLVLGGAAYDADPRGGDLLASADPPAGLPAFRGPRAECADFAGHRFRPLPATAAEAREVAERFGEDAVRLEGDAATEAAFRAQAPGRRVLHLATHGFFLGGGCAGGESGGDGTRGVTGVAPLDGARTLDGARPPDVHPLLLSGLALAGANRRAEAVPGEDDGILTAQEIGALDLGGVEWAVLSACDTGIGRVEAEEGVLGLRRAFAVAGARTVLMSLWPVRDEDARAWMARLYRERAGGATTADAVRAADRAWLAALREAGAGTHPARWGAFVAVGDWR
jgi:CHAT domain-containing protein